MAWYVDSARAPVDLATAITGGTAHQPIWRITAVPPGYIALPLTSYLGQRNAVALGLTARDYVPGESIVVTLEAAHRVINAGQYVGVTPMDSDAVLLALARGAYLSTLFAALNGAVSDAAKAAAIADQEPPPVPSIPTPVLPPTTPGGGNPAEIGDINARITTLTNLVGSTSTEDRRRANHTGTQVAATISDFRLAVETLMAVILRAGPGVTLTRDTTTGTLTVTAAGGSTTVLRYPVGVEDDGVPYYDVAGLVVGGTVAFDDDDVPYLDPSGALGVNLSVDDGGVPYIPLPGDDSDTAVPTVVVDGTAYTLSLPDAGVLLETTSPAATTITVPPDATVAFPVGTVMEITQAGAGQVTITAGAGVTVRTPGASTIRTRWATAGLRKRAVNEWVLSGDLT